MMKKSRLVRFMGGPLHGESREGPDERPEFVISKEAASALKEAILTEGMPPGHIEGADDFRYLKRTDGRYWLAIPVPEGCGKPPAGFTMRWFDAGDGMKLVEIHAPESDWGHAWTEVQVFDELVAHPAMAGEGIAAVMKMASPSLEAKERFLVLQMGQEDILGLSEMILDPDVDRETPGNRRIVASLLKELATRRKSKN